MLICLPYGRALCAYNLVILAREDRSWGLGRPARASRRRPGARPHFLAAPGSPPALLGMRRVRARTSWRRASSAGRNALDARTRRHLSRRTAHLSLLYARIARTRCPHSRVRALGARRPAPSARPDGAMPTSEPCGRRQDAKSAFSPYLASAECKIGLQSIEKPASERDRAS